VPDRLAVKEAAVTRDGFERVPDCVAEVEDAARQMAARVVGLQTLARVRRDDARLERAVLRDQIGEGFNVRAGRFSLTTARRRGRRIRNERRSVRPILR
jgi:hypothetical protein